MNDLPPREWLDVNGCGGYASATVATVLTRKYHGLLVANLGAPAWGRHVLITGLQDAVVDDSETGRLLAPAVVTRDRPQPDLLVPAEFSTDPIPNWDFQTGEIRFQRSLAVLHGKDVAVVRYRTDKQAVKIRLRPLLAYRRNHLLAEQNDFFETHIEDAGEGGFSVSPYVGMPTLHVRVQGAAATNIEAAGEWLGGIYYSEEEARGYPCTEDGCAPATVNLTVEPGRDCYVVLGTERIRDARSTWEQEIARRRQAGKGAAKRSAGHVPARLEHLAEKLDLAAAAFLVQVPPEQQSTVLAGYHWFEDWGRDTMIALPGVAFCRDSLEQGLEVVKTFCGHCRDGRIPNFIGPAGGEPAYNSVDGSLWVFWTVQQYLQHGGGAQELGGLVWPALKEIIRHFAAGTHQDAWMCEDGRLYCGSPDTQLTWMDAAPGGRPVTPRWGHPIEINALWYNALGFARELAVMLDDTEYRAPCDTDNLARVMQSSYWFETGGYIADNINESGTDCRLRPNQIFALALPHTAFSPEQGRRALEAVRNKLLTPRGLRTLSPSDPEYKGRCAGTVEMRDAAYHQGTVWPWLLGGFGEAWLRTHEQSAEAREFLTAYLAEWNEHLEEAGVDTVSEIFDGDPPHNPRGCISQAWSVAEMLRLVHLLA